MAEHGHAGINLEQAFYPSVHGTRVCCLYRPGNCYTDWNPEPWGPMPDVLKPFRRLRYQYSITPIIKHDNTLPYTKDEESLVEGPGSNDFSHFFMNECCEIRWGFDIGQGYGGSITVC